MLKYSCRVKFYRGRTKLSPIDVVIFKIMAEDEKGAYDQIRNSAEFMASGQIYSFYDLGKLTLSVPRVPSAPGTVKSSKAKGHKSASAS